MVQPKVYWDKCFKDFGKDITEVIRKTVKTDETEAAKIGMHEGYYYGTPGFGAPPLVIPSSPFFQLKYYSGFGNSIEVRLFEKKRVIPFVHRNAPGRLYSAMYLNEHYGFVEVSVFDRRVYEPIQRKISEDEPKYAKWFEGGIKLVKQFKPATSAASKQADTSAGEPTLSV